MTNRLASESSPYLLQHKENPVAWYPWGQEALKRAKEEQRPIFLSIGYAACHWCHVMAHESFEDPKTADLMNSHFVNIKVDREERPDLDTIYINAVVAMTGQAGWPLSVFLTPDLEPFYGGTYFPPVARYNMPSFQDVLRGVINAWEEDREQLVTVGEQITRRLKTELGSGLRSSSYDPETSEEAAMTLAKTYDWEKGGWGPAPKFPQAMAIEFLERRAAGGDKLAIDLVKHALLAMSQGGMYDLIGGGFHRYSVDRDWFVPHFEKMLYDNALLARTYLYGYLLTGEEALRDVCCETLDFVVREMLDPAGGFYSSLDADSEGREGLYYLWNRSEVRDVLDDEETFSLFEAAYDLPEGGNFEGLSILRKKQKLDTLAGTLETSPAEVASKLSFARSRLLDARSRRVRPSTDDKVLAAWNGLMLSSIAEAARYLGRLDYRDVAIRNADFLLKEMNPHGKLLRSWRAGEARHNAYLEDYGALILGLLAVYQTDPDTRWFSNAKNLARAMQEAFHDPAGGFFDTRVDHEALILRPKDIQDNATPSGNALASMALLTLSALDGDPDLRITAERPFGAVQSVAARYPTSFGQWLSAIDFGRGPVSEIAVLGGTDPNEKEDLLSTCRSTFSPNFVFAAADSPPQSGDPNLLFNRDLLDGHSTAYVCQGFTCKQPVWRPEDLLSQLLDAGAHRLPDPKPPPHSKPHV